MQHRKRNFDMPTWPEQIDAMRAELADMPPGIEREGLKRKIRQLETASQMKDWLASPGLRPPT